MDDQSKIGSRGGMGRRPVDAGRPAGDEEDSPVAALQRASGHTEADARWLLFALNAQGWRLIRGGR